MPIHDKGYRHWQGRRRGRLWRCLTIAAGGIRLALKKRGLVAMVLLGIIPAFLLAILVYLAANPAKFVEYASHVLPGESEWEELVGKSPTVPVIWRVIFSMFFGWQLIPVAIIVAYVGPELISQDLRVGALQVYFSRPLTRLDYILGKLMVVAVFVAMVTVVPAVLIYVVGVVLEKDPAIVAETWPTLAGIFATYLLVTVVSGGVVLACSSLSRRSGHVAGMWAVLVILSDVAYFLVRDALALNWAHLLSLRANLVQTSTRIFAAARAYPWDWAASAFVLAAVVVVSFGLLLVRLEALEGEH